MKRDNAVRRNCPDCGRTDTLIDLSTGVMCRHRVRKARGALWCAGSGAKLADPALPPQPHPRGGYNPLPTDAVTDVIEGPFAVGDRVIVDSALAFAHVVEVELDSKNQPRYTVEFPEGDRLTRYAGELTGPPSPRTLDESRSVRTVRGGLPTLGKR